MTTYTAKTPISGEVPHVFLPSDPDACIRSGRDAMQAALGLNLNPPRLILDAKLLQDAAALFRHALELRPNDGAAIFHLGVALRWAGWAERIQGPDVPHVVDE